MQDVAEHAQVSQSTVSRVLNDSRSAIPISEETKQRVWAAARALGYRPNPLARALREGSVHLIGVIVRDIADVFFTPLLSILSTMASANGYNLILGHAQTSSSEALALQNILDSRHCDGIICLGISQATMSSSMSLGRQDAPSSTSAAASPPQASQPSTLITGRVRYSCSSTCETWATLGLGSLMAAGIDGSRSPGSAMVLLVEPELIVRNSCAPLGAYDELTK